MILQEFYEAIQTLGYPVTYRKFGGDEYPETPFLVIYQDDSSIFYADNISYFLANETYLDVYTKNKDPELELEIENKFSGLGLTFDKNQGYTTLDAGGLYYVSYNTDLERKE